MSPEGLVAVMLGVSNIGLTIMLALRKESKEAAIRREQELVGKIVACDNERQALREEVVELRARQHVWDALLPHFKIVPQMAGGRRNYDDGQVPFGPGGGTGNPGHQP